MKLTFLLRLPAVALSGAMTFLTVLSLPSAQAQSALPLPPPPEIRWPEPEPERWTQEDVTLEQRFETARKETLAAHQEELNACKDMPAFQQPECINQAKAQLELELAQLKAKARFGMEPN